MLTTEDQAGPPLHSRSSCRAEEGEAARSLSLREGLAGVFLNPGKFREQRFLQPDLLEETLQRGWEFPKMNSFCLLKQINGRLKKKPVCPDQGIESMMITWPFLAPF